MDREIKFRAWDKENKKIRKVTKMNFFDEYIECDDGNLGEYWTIKYDETILMQYTGLKDKNGKEIYEGDIVIVRGEEGRVTWMDREGTEHQCLDCGIADVEFYEGMWYLNGEVNNALYDLKEMEIEVIGNIYENPELIK